MDDTTFFSPATSFPDRLGPVVIRPGDPPVSVKGNGGGVLVTGPVPREPVPDALLEKARERMRELADLAPAPSTRQKP